MEGLLVTVDGECAVIFIINPNVGPLRKEEKKNIDLGSMCTWQSSAQHLFYISVSQIQGNIPK